MAWIKQHVVRDVLTLEPSATCADAARLMTERGIGSVGVQRGAKIVGFVTERDLVASIAAGADPGRTSLAQVMRTDAPSVTPEATDVECAQLMRLRHTRHLAVKEGRDIVGVLSLLDLVDLVVEEKQANIDQLEAYIRGGRARELTEPVATVFNHGPVAG